MESLLINLGYGLMLAALLARDILWLRVMVLTAQGSLAVYGWTFGDPNVAVWNTIFVLINTVQIMLILRERQPVELNEIQETIYNTIFASMSRRDFLTFWEMGAMRDLNSGRLVREGDAPQELMLLVEGTASVQTAGREIARVSAGQFVAEMSFLSGQPASADVVAEGEVRFLAWSQDKLRNLRILNPNLFIMLQGLLGKDLVRKIRTLNRGN